MALKPTTQHIAIIPESTVKEMRLLYFLEYKTYTQLSEQFGYKLGVIKKAVQGNGKYYSSIKDPIKVTPEIRESRIPANQKYGLTRTINKLKAESKIAVRMNHRL